MRVAVHCWKWIEIPEIPEIREKVMSAGVVPVGDRWTRVFPIARIVGSLCE